MNEAHEHNSRTKLTPAWIVVVSVLATSGFWNVLQQFILNDKPSREEVKVLMRESSPYMQDRGMILTKLEELNKKIDEMRGEIRADRKMR